MQVTLALTALVASAAAAPRALPNIVELAQSVPDLSTLVAAVKAADLVDTLASPGPFTVFAPTNEAFAALPKDVLQHLLTPEGKPELIKILTYHVAAGNVQSSMLQNEQKIKTVEGSNVTVHIHLGHVFLQDGVPAGPWAQVIKADVEASNGVVHIINKILIPPRLTSVTVHSAADSVPTLNIVELAQSVPALSTLVAAVKAADLVDTLSGTGPFTVFAPTDDAFKMIPPQILQWLLQPANKAELVKVLTYHVVSGNVQAGDLRNNMVIKTVQGEELVAHVNGGVVTLQDRKAERPSEYATVITANVEATNGVVHVINRVLMPY